MMSLDSLSVNYDPSSPLPLLTGHSTFQVLAPFVQGLPWNLWGIPAYSAGEISRETRHRYIKLFSVLYWSLQSQEILLRLDFEVLPILMSLDSLSVNYEPSSLFLFFQVIVPFKYLHPRLRSSMKPLRNSCISCRWDFQRDEASVCEIWEVFIIWWEVLLSSLRFDRASVVSGIMLKFGNGILHQILKSDDCSSGYLIERRGVESPPSGKGCWFGFWISTSHRTWFYCYLGVSVA